MPHLHVEPGQHDLTASAYIVQLDQSEPRLLLHRHKKLGAFLQFGGHVELKETPWQAVTHELLEESGYDLDQLSLLQPKQRIRNLTGADLHPYPVVVLTHEFNEDHKHTDIAWAFVTSEPARHEIADEESKSLQSFSAAELKALPKDTIPENVREIGLFVLETCLNEWGKIPAND